MPPPLINLTFHGGETLSSGGNPHRRGESIRTQHTCTVVTGWNPYHCWEAIVLSVGKTEDCCWLQECVAVHFFEGWWCLCSSLCKDLRWKGVFCTGSTNEHTRAPSERRRRCVLWSEVWHSFWQTVAEAGTRSRCDMAHCVQTQVRRQQNKDSTCE